MPAVRSDPVHIPKAAVIVAGRIRRRIVSGEYPPAASLPNETELMGIYDVSRPVVREALRILESESMITVKRGASGGARVVGPDISVAARYTALLMQWEGTTVADLFEALQILEPAAVGRLATRRPAAAIRALKQRHAEELALVQDRAAFPRTATQFHEDLLELAGNKTMAILGRLLQHIVETHNRMMFEVLDGEGTAVASDAAERSHARVIELIEAGQADKAVALWERHLKEAAALTLERLGPATVVELLERSG